MANPTDRLLAEAERLHASGGLSQARDFLARAIAGQDGNARLWAAAAELEDVASNPAGSVRLWREAIVRANRPRPRWLARLATALGESGAPATETDIAYRAAFQADPTANTGLVRQWASVLVDRGEDECSVDRAVLDAQLSVPHPLPAVLLFLLGRDAADEWRDRLTGHLTEFMGSAGARACGQVCEAYRRSRHWTAMPARRY